MVDIDILSELDGTFKDWIGILAEISVKFSEILKEL